MVSKCVFIMSIAMDLLSAITFFIPADVGIPLWVKICIFIAVFSLGAIACFFTREKKEIQAVNYFYKENGQYVIYTKHNSRLVEGATVTLYYKKVDAGVKSFERVGIGYIMRNHDDNSMTEIPIIKVLDLNTLKKIRTSSKYFENYYIRPFVDYEIIREFIDSDVSVEEGCKDA